MRIEQVTLREIVLPLKSPFVTAHASYSERRLLIVEAQAMGVSGYGEVSALPAPFYTEETPETAKAVLASFLIPIALHTDWQTPRELAAALARVRRHYMAKAGLEAAAWDLYAKLAGKPLANVLGGTRPRIPVGVAVGLDRDLGRLCRTVEAYLAAGYRRIKLKIAPGWDYVPLRAVRQAFGDIPLMADANGSYTLRDLDALRRLDELGLIMIEQPFDAGDFLDHARLQAAIATPVCLDEGIESLSDARHAIELGSCRIVCIKPARVGGLTEAVRIHDLCAAHGVPVWCGGMLESGIGRAHAAALASLPGFSLPADLAASSRYWDRDVISPEVTVAPDGHIELPAGPGIGYAVDLPRLDAVTVWRETFGQPAST